MANAVWPQYIDVPNVQSWLGFDWTAVAAIAASVYTGTFIISIFVLVNQLKATRAAMFSQSYAVACGRVNALEAVRARDMVRSVRNQPAVNRFHGNVEHAGEVISRHDYAALVCRTYDDVGAMARHNMIPEDIILHSWGEELLEQWNILVEFVQRERSETELPRLWHEFEELAQHASNRATR